MLEHVLHWSYKRQAGLALSTNPAEGLMDVGRTDKGARRLPSSSVQPRY